MPRQGASLGDVTRVSTTNHERKTLGVWVPGRNRRGVQKVIECFVSWTGKNEKGNTPGPQPESGERRTRHVCVYSRTSLPGKPGVVNQRTGERKTRGDFFTAEEHVELTGKENA